MTFYAVQYNGLVLKNNRFAVGAGIAAITEVFASLKETKTLILDSKNQCILYG